MDIGYKVALVQKMQDYLLMHLHDEEFDFETLYTAVGYSRRHADRCFQALLGKTPREYYRLLRMSESAKQLLEKDDSILETALSADFQSHEGYTKAFREAFGKLPSEYRKGKSFIPLFIAYPIQGYYGYINKKERDPMENKTCLCMIMPVQRPARKLIFLRSKKATEYWTFCEELGCEWVGLFNSNPAKFDTAAILTLPPFLMKEGYSDIAAGIEVPLDYDGEIPENCEVSELPACEMLYFRSQPFDTEEEFFKLMDEVNKAIKVFDYAANGYKEAPHLAPSFNFGGEKETGVKKALAVEKIR